MADNLERYVPEFDESDLRRRLSGLSAQELTEMLIASYKLRRVIAKQADEFSQKLDRIRSVVEEPSSLEAMPDVPGPDDLHRLFDE